MLPVSRYFYCQFK